jgi:hypothetical protein
MRMGNYSIRFRTGMLLAAILLGFLGLYALTAQRDLAWQDSGVRQWRVLVGDYIGVDGTALSHPLYIGMARAFVYGCPLGSPLWRVNLFSGVGMALALVCLAVLVHRLTGSRRAAAGAAVLLGLAHMPWWLATVTEVYTWSLAGFLLELVLLQALLAAPCRRTLVMLALVSGLGVSIHDLALLALPVYLVVIVGLIRGGQLAWRALGWGALAYGVGSAPFLALVVQDVWVRQRLGAAIASALFGESFFRQVVGCGMNSWAVANAGLFLLNFASPCWLLALVGLRVARYRVAPAFRLALLALTVIHALFFMRYFVADQALFALPILGLLAIWAGLGFGWLVDGVWRRQVWYGLAVVALLLPPLLYWGAWRVVVAGELVPRRARALPFRDEARYWLLPWKHNEHSASAFAQEVFAQCGSNDVVYTDATVAGPLLVTRWMNSTGPSVPWVVTYYDRWNPEREAGHELMDRLTNRAFYVVSPVAGYMPAGLSTGAYAFVRTGVLYRVVARGTDIKR